MKHSFSSFTVIIVLSMASFSCKYKDYDEVYNENGVIILKSKKKTVNGETESLTKDGKAKINKTAMPFDGVDPNDGKPIPNSNDAITLIKLYQDELTRTRDISSTRYVDFYFKNIGDY